MQNGDLRPQWNSYYPSMDQHASPYQTLTFQVGSSVHQSYSSRSQSYHAGHGSVYGNGNAVASSSPGRSLRDPYRDDYFPFSGQPVYFGPDEADYRAGVAHPLSIELEYLPRCRRFTGRPVAGPILFNCQGVPGVPLGKMLQKCPIDAGHTDPFNGWADSRRRVNWVLDYPGLPTRVRTMTVFDDETNFRMNRFRLALTVCEGISKVLEAAQKNGLSNSSPKWSLKDGKWRKLRLVALVLYPGLLPPAPPEWVPIVALQVSSKP
ncbi:hypothetical protein GYMLUDRAFT_251802 [Collybiopsis luxurians FD-317 M1]|uniref:Uncharacterized protein n=1 Tax=Collybiopsis luxurians FD-317 M1 TaxID=944289 RepID=A0A0D0C1R5_9AGAR|nr:hypothetical protein GYMLUDRAFT_251802 [Collybiopsis luxurians FD-317 M1]